MLFPAVPLRSLHLLPLLISALALVACQAKQPAQPAEIGGPCATHQSCRSGFCLTEESFVDGYCSQDCGEDETCPEEAGCEAAAEGRFCLRFCEADEDCRSGYACNYGTCRPACIDNGGCRPPDTCAAGSCRPPCKADRECPEKHRCLQQKCLFYCEEDLDCGEESRCQLGKCLPPCAADPDCLPGYTCNTESGRCDPRPGKKLGEPCQTGPDCATGYCLPTRKLCSIQCTASSQCPAPSWVCGLERIDVNNDTKFEKAEPACVPVKGPGGVGALCESDQGCASDHCYDGFCMEACATDADCGPHQCQPVTIILNAGLPSYKGCLPRQGVSNYLVGSFPGAGTTRYIDIPPGAQSFVLSAEVASTTEMPFFAQLSDPDNAILSAWSDVCSIFTQPIRHLPAEQTISMMVPNTPKIALKPGRYAFTVGSSAPSLPVTVRLQLKLGRAEKGVLNINWSFLDLSSTCIPGAKLTAASAPSHPWFTKMRNNMATILKTAGLSLGKETYQDLGNPGLDVINLAMQGDSPELQQLFASSKGIQGNAINVFIIRKFEVQNMAGIVLGLAGGIPGPLGVHGTVHSGIALSAETSCFEAYGYNTGHTMAHEIGHYLGLFHSVEEETSPGFDGAQVVCPCPCGSGMFCQSGWGTSWCRAEDPIPDSDRSTKNLMFFAAESTQMFEGNQLSPGQIRVLLDSPLVGH